MNGAQWLVQALRTQGVDTVFGYPGGAIMPVYDALYDGGVEHVLCRHEQGAVMAAIGYARAGKRTGVCIATSGPGATNLITGLADALMDSVPLVAITGQVGSSLIGTDAFQEIDVLGLSLSCTKHSFLVESVTDLPRIMTEAFAIAAGGRPGPVLIDIPKDIQLQISEFTPYLLQAEAAAPLSQTDLALARQLMRESRKPVLYAGGGMAGAVSELRAFLAETGIPAVSTLKGLGAVAPDYPHYLGMLGMHGAKAANLAVQEADLLIAAGARFDDRVTGRLNAFAPDAKVIHVDIDPAELDKLRRTHVSFAADAAQVLPLLAQPLSLTDWQRRTAARKVQFAPDYSHPGDAVYAPALLAQVSAAKPVDAVVTTDVGQHQMWTAQHMTFDGPENFLTSGGLGTMGFGLPAAVGAQMARPDATVLCVSGDGSFMMNVQELTTIKRKQLPVKILLLDNQRLGMVRQWQALFFGKRYSETVLDDNPDFVALAGAFDIPGQRVTLQSELPSAIRMLMNHNGPYLLHVAIREDDNVWPLVPPGAANEQMMESTL